MDGTLTLIVDGCEADRGIIQLLSAHPDLLGLEERDETTLSRCAATPRACRGAAHSETRRDSAPVTWLLYFSVELAEGELLSFTANILTQECCAGRHRMPAYRVCRTGELDWEAQWRTHFRPILVSRHLAVGFPWHPYSSGKIGADSLEDGAHDGVQALLISPGLAFGTGLHETTRLCLSELDRLHSLHHTREERGKAPTLTRSLLDVGFGSGILSIAATRLGFRPVGGVDNDPQVLSAALANAELNQCADRIHFTIGTLDAIRTSEGELSSNAFEFDVVVANIMTEPLMSMRDVLVSAVRHNGSLVLSGIGIEDRARVEAHFSSADLRLTHCAIMGEWVLFSFARQS